MKVFSTISCALISVFVNAQPCIPNTNSIQFDGASSYVTISPQTGLDITATVTIEAWIKPASFGFNSAQNSIVCKHGWSSGEGGFVLRCGGTGELSFNIGGVDTNGVNVSWVEVFSATNVLSLNTWSHVAGTFDGSVLKCYVNGVVVGTTVFAGSIAPSNAYPLAIGRLADPVWGPDRYFSGSMDEVRVWNRALSDVEIQGGMNNHIDPASASGLVSYWRMNEGAGSTVYDVASANNGGTVFCSWDTSVPFNAVPAVPVITYNGGTLYSSAPVGNQWYLGGTAIGGATQNSFTPLQNGVYEVEVTSAQGCSTMSAQFTVIDVGVHMTGDEVAVHMAPAPLQDNSTLEINSLHDLGKSKLIITDLTGRKMRELSFSIISGTTKIPLERNEFRRGIYFFEIQTARGIFSTGKIVVD